MTSTLRTRFAPSPTGYLHIGGARTALFNFLVARRLGGKFVLRIEDTDQTRNIANADQKLRDDLQWLGLNWDEGPGCGGPAEHYYQSQRLEHYKSAIDQLLAAGHAYYAFDTTEELDAQRTAAREAKQDYRYARPDYFPTSEEAEAARAAGRPVVVRLKMPDHDWVVKDQILGEVTFAAREFDDFVIQKNDGWPTYHLAVVVDDADMQITHVIRGKEHLMNTPKHMALQEWLGLPTPEYAHLPLIFNIDGSKMSKRDKDKVVRQAYKDALKSGSIDQGAAIAASQLDDSDFSAWLSKKIQLPEQGLATLAELLTVTLPEIDVHDFRLSGYLPEALVNFIALLGWSAGDDREKYTLDELCQSFDLKRVNKTDSKFDREKLLSFNTDAAATANPQRLLVAYKDYLSLHPQSPLADLPDDMLTTLLRLCAGYHTFPDIETKAGRLFIPDDQVPYDPAAIKKFLLKGDPSGLTLLAEMRDLLATQDAWDAASLEAGLGQAAEQRGVKLGKLAQPIRVGVTGWAISPPIFDTLVILGKERTLARIDRAREVVKNHAQD
jgi:glutamyl/glutaminyl-tRNA synthetase